MNYPYPRTTDKNLRPWVIVPVEDKSYMKEYESPPCDCGEDVHECDITWPFSATKTTTAGDVTNVDNIKVYVKYGRENLRVFRCKGCHLLYLWSNEEIRGAWYPRELV